MSQSEQDERPTVPAGLPSQDPNPIAGGEQAELVSELAGTTALEQLKSAASAPELFAALTHLLAADDFSTLAADPAVRAAAMRYFARSSSFEPAERLLAAILVARLALGGKLEKALSSELANRVCAMGIPPLEALPLPRDLDALMKFAATKKLSNAVVFCANSLVVATGNTKLVSALVHVLMRSTETWAQGVWAISDAIARGWSETVISSQRRLLLTAECIAGIRTTIPSLTTRPGPDFGRAVGRLFKDAMGADAVRLEEKLQRSTVSELVALVEAGVAHRGSLALDSALLDVAIDACSTAKRWKPIAPLRKATKELTEQVLEVLMTLAEAGIVDRSLYERFAIIAGGQEAALKLVRSALPPYQEMRPDVREALTTGNFSTGASVQESILETIEHAVAIALRHSQEIKHSESDVLAASRAMSLANDVEGIAAVMGMTLQGIEGEQGEYRPLQHQLSTTRPIGLRKVRIIVPAVVRTADDGSVRMILPALVEPMEGE